MNYICYFCLDPIREVVNDDIFTTNVFTDVRDEYCPNITHWAKFYKDLHGWHTVGETNYIIGIGREQQRDILFDATVKPLLILVKDKEYIFDAS